MTAEQYCPIDVVWKILGDMLTAISGNDLRLLLSHLQVVTEQLTGVSTAGLEVEAPQRQKCLKFI